MAKHICPYCDRSQGGYNQEEGYFFCPSCLVSFHVFNGKSRQLSLEQMCKILNAEKAVELLARTFPDLTKG